MTARPELDDLLERLLVAQNWLSRTQMRLELLERGKLEASTRELHDAEYDCISAEMAVKSAKASLLRALGALPLY